jgi:hypothetical protein
MSKSLFRFRNSLPQVSTASQPFRRSSSWCRRCSTAAASEHPASRAAPTDSCNLPRPYCWPSFSRPTICRVPLCFPYRAISACQIRSKLAGHKPACRCWSRAVESLQIVPPWLQSNGLLLPGKARIRVPVRCQGGPKEVAKSTHPSVFVLAR